MVCVCDNRDAATCGCYSNSRCEVSGIKGKPHLRQIGADKWRDPWEWSVCPDLSWMCFFFFATVHIWILFKPILVLSMMIHAEFCSLFGSVCKSMSWQNVARQQVRLSSMEMCLVWNSILHGLYQMVLKNGKHGNCSQIQYIMCWQFSYQ